MRKHQIFTILQTNNSTYDQEPNVFYGRCPLKVHIRSVHFPTIELHRIQFVSFNYIYVYLDVKKSLLQNVRLRISHWRNNQCPTKTRLIEKRAHMLRANSARKESIKM